MKAIYIDGLPTVTVFTPIVVEVERDGKRQMRILKHLETVDGETTYTPTRVSCRFIIPYSDELWATCKQMKEQENVLWKLQLNLSEMAMKEIEE